MAGERIAEYVERAFTRFPDLTPTPRTPWDQLPKAGLDLVRAHLEDRYGPVTKMRQLDAGVLRVDRADDRTWIARVAPSGRPMAEFEGDANVLAYLAEQDLPTERLAHEEPVTEVGGRGVLVTAFVPGKPPAQARPFVGQLGDMLGRLHALPPGPDLASRTGGGWHGLSYTGGGRDVDIATLDALLEDAVAVAPQHSEPIAAIREALAGLDMCDGLPETLTNVDLGGPNVLRAPKSDPVFIDWTGCGRAPRITNVASVGYYLGPSAVTEVMAAYRQHVTLEPEELDRLEGTLATHQLVLAAWGLVFRPEQAYVVADRLSGLADHVRNQAKLIRNALR